MASNGSGDGDMCLDPSPTTLLLLPLLLSLVWVLLDVFYSSPLLGWAVTRVAAFFLTDSAITLGGIQVSLLTGRILFKDLHYHCRDYAIRVTDGYASFHWWKRAGIGGCVCSGSSERKTALVLFQLNGFQLHWYNRSEVYDAWGKVHSQEAAHATEASDNSFVWSLWKKLQPSFHFKINKGQMVFGSQMVERSLAVYCQVAEAHYHTTKASNKFDELMHVVRLWVSDVKAVLEPSEGHSPPRPVPDSVDHPLLHSDSANVTYSWDSPGLVPLGETPDPKFSWDIELGSNSVINYGAYANHQRHLLQKFFFPNDYTERPASPVPQAGERRVYTNMDVTVRLSSRGSFNIPFCDEKEVLHQIGLSLGKGSEVKVCQPWLTSDDGYTSTVTGNLEGVVVTSDLSYPHFASATLLQLNVALHFPRIWNSTQHWDMQLTTSQVEISILFSYVDFVNALIDDWLGTGTADLLHFVPVDWSITASLSDYEIYLFTSRYNWLDRDNKENSQLAFCGRTGQIRLHFPFTAFNPAEQRVAFTANGQNVVVRHFVPPSNSAREAILALSAANKYRWRVLEASGSEEGLEVQTAEVKETESKEAFPMGYRGHTSLKDGWVDLACGPSISLNINYVSRAHHMDRALPSSLQVDIGAPTVLLRVFGFLATDLLALKENYPGEYVEFSTYHSTSPSEPRVPVAPQPPLREAPPAVPPSGVPDVPCERFLDVVVDFALHNITAEFPTFPSQGQPVNATLPSACTAELAVHVDYTAADTKAFLHICPFTVLIPSWPSQQGSELGHIACGGIQLNCHGLTEMLCRERVEYAWLMQLQLHRISAALTTLQLAEVAGWLQATVQQTVGVADSTVAAPNGQPIRPLVDPLSEDIKYFLFDLSVAETDVHLVEGESLLRLQSPGLDMGMCKLHAGSETLGLSLLLHALTCSVCMPMSGGTSRMLEVGRVEMGLIEGDIALQEPKDCVPERQRTFLRRADAATRRLWFLWDTSGGTGLGCGCCGGCQFLDGSISPRPPRPSTTCAGDTADHLLPSQKAGALAEAFGLHSLKTSLQSVCIRDVACPQLIHTGLLGYYNKCYEGEASPSQTLIGSDTESYVSARASPSDSGSLSNTNEFYSLENVNEAGLEGQTLLQWRRPKSKLEGDSATAGKQREARPLLVEEDPLHPFLPSYVYQTIPIYVSIKTPTPQCKALRERHTHRRQHSDGQFFGRRPHHMRTASEVPHTTSPSTPQAPPSCQHQAGDHSILLWLPFLVLERRGNLPSWSTSTSREKKKAANRPRSDEHQPQFLVGVNISVSGSVSATLSPSSTHIVTSIIKTLAHYFQQRGALAVLTGCSLETSLSLGSYLGRLLCSHQPQPFSAHISLGMDPKACITVQLVQSLPQRYRLSSELSASVGVPMCSLLTATVFGLYANSLVRTHTQTVAEHDDVTTVSSLQLSLQGGSSSMQLSLAVKLSGDATFPPSLPNLLTNSSRLEAVVDHCSGLCSLLEAGCVSPSFTVAAKLVTLEVSHRAVLTWEHVLSHPLEGVERVTCEQQEEVTNKVAVSVSLPQVWADVAAPPTCKTGTSTGMLKHAVCTLRCVGIFLTQEVWTYWWVWRWVWLG
jgi:hypothetical protein